MKPLLKRILLNILFLLPSVVFGQPRLNFVNSADPYEKVIYVGVENYFRVEGIKQSLTPKNFKMSFGSVEEEYDKVFRIRISTEKSYTLKIYSGNKILYSEILESKTIPSPVAVLKNIPDSFATVDQILKDPFLIVSLPGCNYKLFYQVTSFTTEFIFSDSNTIVAHNLGNLLNNEQKKIIERLKAGDRIHFTNIRALSPDSRGIKLSPFTIILK